MPTVTMVDRASRRALPSSWPILFMFIFVRSSVGDVKTVMQKAVVVSGFASANFCGVVIGAIEILSLCCGSL